MRIKFALLLSGLVLSTATMHADTFSDGFAAAMKQQLATTTVGNFSAVNGTNVDALGPSNYGNLCTGVSYCVDLGGSGGNAYGNLVSNTTFGIGTYNLSFYLTGSERGTSNTVQVILGNYNQTFMLGSTDVRNVVNQLVTVTNPGTLSFILSRADDPNQGAVLNSASVTSVAATPEPSSLMLLGTGLVGGITQLVRRRRASQLVA